MIVIYFLFFECIVDNFYPCGLQEKNIERGCVMEMLRDVLGIIWDFLRCDAK